MKKIVLFVIAIAWTVGVMGQQMGSSKNQMYFSKNLVKSYLNQKAPKLLVEKWLTVEPDTVGKFILFEFYGRSCLPCWEAVPKLNDFHKKYKDKMVIIGVSKDTGRLPQEPDADYYKGLDREGRTSRALGLKIVPWALLIDLNGIVRWEGSPNDLTDEIIKKFLKDYKKKLRE